MSGEDVVPLHNLHKFLTNFTRKFRDHDLYKSIFTGYPLKIQSRRLV